MVGAVFLGQIVSTLAKNAFHRARPDLVPHGSYVFTSSFPSGHSMMAAIVYLTLGLLAAGELPGRGIKSFVIAFSLFITIAVGVSRVYLGVHWPTDVLAGWCAGAAWALACWSVERVLKRTGAVEPESKIAIR
jgi:undecaprenyl-diphosphatase